jgi:hypothetical protein
MAPFEKHGIWVPKDATEDMKMVVCGVTVGAKKRLTKTVVVIGNWINQ